MVYHLLLVAAQKHYNQKSEKELAFPEWQYVMIRKARQLQLEQKVERWHFHSHSGRRESEPEVG